MKARNNPESMEWSSGSDGLNDWVRHCSGEGWQDGRWSDKDNVCVNDRLSISVLVYAYE